MLAVQEIYDQINPEKRTDFWKLAIGSIGVVYGDIGTSPLYALKESLTAAAAGGRLTSEMILGVLSLMLWALTIVVTLKYVLLIMRADNHGEGGTLTLMALLQRVMGRNFLIISLMGMAGAALFYGDAIITPAISVLSAVEGLKLVTPAFDPFILPLSMTILGMMCSSCTTLIPVRKVRSPQSGVIRLLYGLPTGMHLPSVRLHDPGHRRFPGYRFWTSQPDVNPPYSMNRLLDFSGPHKAISYSISPLSNNRALCAGAALYEQAVRRLSWRIFFLVGNRCLSYRSSISTHSPIRHWRPTGAHWHLPGITSRRYLPQPPRTSTVCH